MNFIQRQTSQISKAEESKKRQTDKQICTKETLIQCRARTLQKVSRWWNFDTSSEWVSITVKFITIWKHSL